MAIEHEVAIKPDIVFAEHDGVKLLGDLYLPKGVGKAPALVAVHGDGRQLGDRKFYGTGATISPNTVTPSSQSNTD